MENNDLIPQIVKNERAETPPIATEIYKPDSAVWDEIKIDIISLEKEAFGEKAFKDEEITKDFLNEKNTIALLREKDKVIGFAYARSLDEADEPGRESEVDETVYLWNIVIGKEYRGKHLLGNLMGALEDEFRKKNYSYMEGVAMVANNFAANLAKYYGSRIVQSEPRETEYGNQVFFRIKL